MGSLRPANVRRARGVREQNTDRLLRVTSVDPLRLECAECGYQAPLTRAGVPKLGNLIRHWQDAHATPGGQWPASHWPGPISQDLLLLPDPCAPR
jgi:hypothetical protein